MANYYYYYDNISTSPHQQNNNAVIKQQQDLIPAALFQYNNDYANVLQDDGFSIASYPIVPDLHVAAAAIAPPPAPFSVASTTAATYLQVDQTQQQQFFYQSDASPQLSECFSTSSTNSNGFSMCYYPQDPAFMGSLFPPVMESNSSNHDNASTGSSKKKRKTTSLTDKRHICPVCSHR